MTSSKKSPENKILTLLALLSIEFVVVFVVSIAASFLFFWLSSHVVENEIDAFDEKIYLFVRSLASSSIDQLMLSATFFGDKEFVIFPLAGLIIYYSFLRPHKWFAIKVLAVTIGSIATNLILKQFYGRARPALDYMVEVNNFSFPSGHAMFSMSFYGLLIYIVWKEITNKIISISCSFLLVILIALIGISRIYLGVHYASDVFAGFLAGFLWLVITLSIIVFIEEKFESQLKKLD